MTEEELYQRIEDYLGGGLGKDEKAAFEKQLSSDAELARKVRLHKLADELVIEHRLQSVNEILFEEKNKGRFGNNFKLLLSAAIFLAGTSWYVFWKAKPSSPEVAPLTNASMIQENTAQEKAKTVATRPANTVVETMETNGSTKTILPEPASEPLATNDKKETIAANAEPMPLEKKIEVKENVSTPVMSEKNIQSPCTNIQLEAKVSTTASCREGANGAILVRELNGGTAPYSVSIQNKQQEPVASIGLPAGQYNVVIHDKKGCSRTIQEVKIPEKACEQEYTFNPFIDEQLELPSQDQYSTLAVYDRSGNLYFTKETGPSEEIRWNGYSRNGELNAGYFIFVLTLKDGQALKGGITIVR